MYLNFYYEVSIKCIVALAYQCVTSGFSPVVFSFLQLSLFSTYSLQHLCHSSHGTWVSVNVQGDKWHMKKSFCAVGNHMCVRHVPFSLRSSQFKQGSNQYIRRQYKVTRARPSCHPTDRTEGQKCLREQWSWPATVGVGRGAFVPGSLPGMLGGRVIKLFL